MKRILILLFCLPLITWAQHKPLVIEGVSPSLYLNHVVAPKENYYSIGRLYNISPKEIAPFNNLQMETGLSLNQALKIPLLANNFLQTGDAGIDEALVPVYHAVQGKESLFRVSMNYNKLPVETIKKWNNLKADALTNGTNLIVGYLKVKKDLSAFASMAKSKPADAAPKVEAEKKIVVKETVKTEKPTKIETVKEIPKEVTRKKPPVAEVVKKDPPAAVNKDPEPVKTIVKTGPKNFEGGVFKKDFEQQATGKELANETGTAAVFKSTSGWEDGKYYCLNNGVPAGTIIKITNAANGKSVYAKSLDIMPDIDQNSGLLIRVSNAAANELGALDNKFTCTLSFSK